MIVDATREGFPVLDGLESFLRGVRAPARPPGFRGAQHAAPSPAFRTPRSRDSARGSRMGRAPRRERCADAAQGGGPAGQRRPHRRERGRRARRRARARVPGRAEDREAGHRPQERACKASTLASRTTRRSPRPGAISPKRIGSARAGRADDRGARRRDAARHGARRAVRPGRPDRRRRRARRGARRCGLRRAALRRGRGRAARRSGCASRRCSRAGAIAVRSPSMNSAAWPRASPRWSPRSATKLPKLT